jgi:hypothetical protein
MSYLFELLSPTQLLTLFVIILVVYMVIVKGLTSELILGFIAMWGSILYIGFDNLGAWDCPKLLANKSKERIKLDKKLINQQNELENDNIKKAAANAIKKVKEGLKEKDSSYPPPPVIKPFSERHMPLEYSEENYKENLFPELSGLADNRLSTLQKFRSNRNRVAMDNQSRQDKYTNIGYFQRELDNTANSRWWDDESLQREF